MWHDTLIFVLGFVAAIAADVCLLGSASRLITRQALLIRRQRQTLTLRTGHLRVIQACERCQSPAKLAAIVPFVSADSQN